MHEWQKGIFSNAEVMKPGALFSATFIGEEIIGNGEKVRFKYEVVDEDGEKQQVNRSFPVVDKSRIRHWLKNHTDCDFSDASMNGIKSAVHLVQIQYFNNQPYIANVLPVDGDIHV